MNRRPKVSRGDDLCTITIMSTIFGVFEFERSQKCFVEIDGYMMNGSVVDYFNFRREPSSRWSVSRCVTLRSSWSGVCKRSDVKIPVNPARSMHPFMFYVRTVNDDSFNLMQSSLVDLKNYSLNTIGAVFF